MDTVEQKKSINNFIICIHTVIEEILKEFLKIKNLNKNDLKKYGKCEKNIHTPFRECYFYKNKKILSVEGNIITKYF